MTENTLAPWAAPSGHAGLGGVLGGAAEQQTWRASLIGALAVAIALTSLLALPPWRLFEARLFNLLSIVSPLSPEEPGAVIVAVDEPSLAEIGRQWPWPRDLHARLVRSLRDAGATVIVFDMIFAEPSTEPADRALVAAMGDDIVLAGDTTVLETHQALQTLRVEPMPELLEAGAAVGIASVQLDGDGMLRRIPTFPDGLAAQALARAGTAPTVPTDGLIQYFGPPRTYPTVSYYQALEPATFLPPGFFEGRTVIVGLSLQNAPKPDSGAPDVFATPYTLIEGRLTAGAEVQATILDNLKHGLFIRPASLWAQLASIVALAFAAAVVAHRGIDPVSGAAALGLVAVAVAGSWMLLRFGRVWLPPALPALAAFSVAAAQGLRDYARERRLRRNVARAFNQYLAPAMVERLMRDPGALRLGGERKTLSILFCDVRGFTSLSEAMKDDPEGLTRLINQLLGVLADAVRAEGGTIDKYIGDCIMAFWNAPLDDEDHAGHAVASALGMLTAVERLNADLAQEVAEAEASGVSGPPTGVPVHLAVGIGVNTGDCIVGNMGSEDHFDYSALGDAVNLASRLEGASKRYGVPLLIGPETERQVRDRYVTVELDRIAVKGRAGATAVHTVLGVAPETPVPAVSALRAAQAAMLESYRSQRWDEAEGRIAEVRALAPKLGGYCDAMTARIVEYRTAPPPPGWGGVYEAVEK